MKRFSLLLTVLLALTLAALPIVFSCAAGDEEEDDVQPTTLDEGDDDDGSGAPGDDDDDAGDDDDDTTPPDDGVDDSGPCDGLIEPHQITYTPWGDLSEATKTLFLGLYAEEVDAQIFYGRFVYWYGMARELTRSARAYYNYENASFPLSRWEEEQIAAQLAISYFDGRGENDNLLEFHLGVVVLRDSLRDTLPEPLTAAPDPQTFFENHEAAILTNTNALLWYQAEWALEAIAAQGEAEFHELLAEHLCGAVDAAATLDPQQPHISFDDLLPQLVFDGFNADLANWELRLNPQLVLVTGQLPALISYF